MKKVININFQGQVIPIEESAYDILKQYIESLRRFFDKEEGRDEIINDIESRIAELFGETLKKGTTCITDDDVNAIIKSMGRPEEFEAEEAETQSRQGGESKQQKTSYEQSEPAAGARPHRLFRDENNKVLGGVCAGIANYFGIDRLIVRILFIIFAFGFGFGFIVYLVLWVAVPSTASTVIGSTRKRLFRDPDNKIIAGVCSGLSQYFGVNVWIPRVLFLIPFISFVFRWAHWGAIDFPNFVSLSFSPGATLIYIILWLVLPEAVTTSDKLEMKGEKVDLNTIKNTIQQDMQGFGDRAKEFGKEVGERAKEIGTTLGEKGRKVGTEAGTMARRSGSGIGDAIGLVFKIFAYFILACVLFAVVVALFSTGVVLTGFLPVKDYVISNGWQNIFAWGTLILFIWVPVVGIITWIIRRITKMRSNSRAVRFVFVSLWILGWFCLIALIASMRDAFRYQNNVAEEAITLSNPKVDKLELRSAKTGWYYSERNFLHFEPFANFDEDTVYVNNHRLRIIKSPNDSFQVFLAKMSSGSSKQEANELASKIDYRLYQKDSTLYFDRGIKITTNEKFRNQTVYITVAVPVGKRIQVDDNVGWYDHVDLRFGWDNDWNYRRDFYDGSMDFTNNVEYIMTKDGLKRTHPEIKRDENDNNENQQEQVNPNPQDKVKKDSNEYRYKPSESKPKQVPPAKPDTEKKDTLPAGQAKSEIKSSFPLPSAFIERFTI